jgi:Cft2 family RNA processing exonuclease
LLSLTEPVGQVKLLMRIYPEGRVEFEDFSIMLDHAGRDGEPVVISHAHSDHAVRRGRIIASPETARLLEVRYGVKSAEPIEYGEPISVGDMKVTLYPSGHILGSSQVLIETNQTSLLYSGDVKLRESYSCRPIQIPRAENLIVEATFGTHLFQWPKRELIERQIFAFIEKSLSGGRTPVFMAYSLGKSQELLALLVREKIPVSVSKTVWKMSKVYEEFGVNLGDYRLYENQEHLPGVLVVPSQRARFLKLRRPRFAFVSGWAMTRRFNRGAYQIPLSDHADFGELLRYVDMVKPLKVYTTHGYARELATALRHRGYDARPLSANTQSVQLSI